MAINVTMKQSGVSTVKSPCACTGCPINTDIPNVIQMFLNGKITEAGKTLFNNNPLSVICSLICNHENQCEGHCVLNRKGAPVQFSSIENYISSNYFDKLKLECEQKNGKKVGIIGAGPAGITIAIMLAQKGYDITIFESKGKNRRRSALWNTRIQTAKEHT